MGKCPFCMSVLPQTAKVTRTGGVYACTNCWNPCVARHEVTGIVCEPLFAFADYRREAVSPVAVTRDVIPKLGAALENLPVLPEVPQRIMSMAHDPLTNLSDIARVINEDAVIAMKVLRAANSAFYGSSHEIRNLDLACARLGMKMVVKVTYAAAGGQVYRGGDPTFREQLEPTWRHALATAYCAGEIAVLVPGVSTDDAFLAGLIHDIGRVVLLDIFTGRYGVSPSMRAGSLDDCLHIVSSYRALAGLHVVQRWNLSQDFRVSTLCNQHPASIPLDEHRLLTSIVSLADDMADSFGYSCGPVEEVTLTNHPALEPLRMESSTLERIHGDMTERIESLVEVLAA